MNFIAGDGVIIVQNENKLVRQGADFINEGSYE